MSRVKGTRGITLIELVVAMAIFALVAVMGLQTLTGMVRMRDRLAEIEQKTGQLSYATALIRHDLAALIPVLFFSPGGAPNSSIELRRNGQELGLSIGGQQDLPPVQGLGLHRAEWRYDSNGQRLLRRIWPVLSPANPSAALPEVVVLDGVIGFEVRTYWQDIGWRNGTESGVPAVAPTIEGFDSDSGPVAVNSYSDDLPLAVELRLETLDFGPILLVESLK